MTIPTNVHSGDCSICAKDSWRVYLQDLLGAAKQVADFLALHNPKRQ